MRDNLIINWSKDEPLTWDDFQGKVDNNSPHDAVSSIRYWGTFSAIPNDSEKPTKFQFTEFTLTAQFQKNSSWVKKQEIQSKEISQKLLKHEQGHFDLAEELKPDILRRVNSVLKGRSYSVRGDDEENMKINAQEDGNSLFMKQVEKWKKEIFDKEGEKYDDETNHGTILTKQNEYDVRFNKLRT